MILVKVKFVSPKSLIDLVNTSCCDRMRGRSASSSGVNSMSSFLGLSECSMKV